jgi:hypothetical protein
MWMAGLWRLAGLGGFGPEAGMGKHKLKIKYLFIFN